MEEANGKAHITKAIGTKEWEADGQLLFSPEMYINQTMWWPGGTWHGVATPWYALRMA